jgi:predicted CopG family antitoxin
MTEILKSTAKATTGVLGVFTAATTGVVESIKIASSPFRFLGKTIGFLTDNVSGLDEKKEKSPSFSDYLLEGGSNKRRSNFRSRSRSKSKSNSNKILKFKAKKSRTLKIKFKPSRFSLKFKRSKRKNSTKRKY